MHEQEDMPWFYLRLTSINRAYFRASDFKGQKKLRIKSVTAEDVGTGADKENKLVVWFTNDERGLILNKTNNRTLRGAFGDATDGWVGRDIILFSTEADLRGKMVPALRVRIPPPKQTAGNGDAARLQSRRSMMSWRTFSCCGRNLP